MLKREDMLELTRRMTLSRNCFARLAGAYMDKDGYEDGSFHVYFGNLDNAEAGKKLEIAKAIPFSETNRQLKEYSFSKNSKESMQQMLLAMIRQELKDDALPSVFYEIIGESYRSEEDYCIMLYYGSYDIPVKGTDKEWNEGSEEVYNFLICTISPLVGEYEPDKPEFGFLYPSFSNRSEDRDRIAVFHKDPDRVQKETMKKILGD